ncbi:MAG: trehalose-6-phosphate synthase [Myxococcota bacterium]
MVAERSGRSSLVVVSNRLPVRLHHDAESHTWEATQGGGGLVQALEPMLRQRGGGWVGWPNVVENAPPGWQTKLEEAGRARGMAFHPIQLTEADVREFYGGFSNEVLWPLFHGLDDRAVFHPDYFGAFDRVNAKFAEAAFAAAAERDLIWVHDFQLIAVAQHLRQLGYTGQIAFFLHIPFPSLDGFLKLPWRGQVLSALLDYDLVGFQTERDRRNFLDCVERLLPDASFHVKDEPEALTEVFSNDRKTMVGTFPIGIDHKKVVSVAKSEAVEKRTLQHRVQLNGRAVLLGVDRLDYTKGIHERLLAFERLLSENPGLSEEVLFIQVVQPSRTTVDEYKELKRDIDRLVGDINGRYGTPGWAPIHYLYRSIDWTELFALYRVARVAVITPLKDGMNLVAKEYCACQIDEPGTLVLSEFAGAAAQLHHHAIITNPYDVEGTAHALRAALSSPLDERRLRVEALNEQVRREDVFWWTRRFLRAVGGGEVDYVAEYLPELEYDSRSSASGTVEAAELKTE